MSHDVIKRSEPTDDYEVLQRVGNGTYGSVYKARDLRNGRFAAVKVIKLEPNDNFAIIQQEIYVLRECVHPNIISYYGSYIKRSRLWIITEYCSGGSLQDVYQMTGPLTELQIAFVCRETLKGLQYLHEKGKIHRDVKGANILLTVQGDCKIADFGVAGQITTTLAKRKSFIGTPYWMAPEVVNVEEKGGYGFECDVWAVGITAIELAETTPPFYHLQPMQVLHMMTKSNFKPPKLKDKKKWSPLFHEFLKLCLAKNPKKRPLPEKLLQSNSFVCGALSSRFTKELLDRVNDPQSGRTADSKKLHDSLRLAIDSEIKKREKDALSSDETGSESSPSEQTPEPIRNYRNDRTLKANRLPGEESEEDELSVGLDEKKTPQQTTHDHLPPPNFPQRVHHNSTSSRKESPQPKVEVEIPPSGVKLERSSSLEHPADGHSPLNGMLAMKGRDRTIEGQTPFSTRPTSFYGIVSTPKVNMGACFCTIFHDCRLRVHSSSVWIHPSSRKQYLIIGAEEGIFSLNLSDLHENSLQQINDRRCSSLFVIGDVMIALQGKTNYLYHHNILQLISQELIVQKCTKKMTKIPEKFKPRLLQATIRIPETKDAYKFNVERSVLNGQLYLCCAVPNQLILFQWFEPRGMFVMLKSVTVEHLPRANLRPFNFVFGAGSFSADYPQVCIGVYDKQIEGNEENEAAADRNHRECQLEYRLVDFNDNGRLSDFAAKSLNADLFHTLGVGTSSFTYSDRIKREIVNFRQLDRDTIFLAFEDRIIITDLEGRIKKTNLMHTSFDFDFKITAAVPLPDSVLAFHSNGLQGRSFFNGVITQELNDPSKIYDVIGSESMIILQCRLLERRGSPPLLRSTTSSTIPRLNFMPSVVFSKSTAPEKLPDPVDLVLLTGHVASVSTTLKSP